MHYYICIAIHYIHTYTDTHIHTYIHAYIHTYTHMYTHTKTHTHMYIYVEVCAYRFSNVYVIVTKQSAPI